MLHLFFICALCIRKLGLAATTLADLDTAIKKQQWNEAAEGNMVLRQFLRGHDYFLVRLSFTTKTERKAPRSLTVRIGHSNAISRAVSMG